MSLHLSMHVHIKILNDFEDLLRSLVMSLHKYTFTRKLFYKKEVKRHLLYPTLIITLDMSSSWHSGQCSVNLRKCITKKVVPRVQMIITFSEC